ncbi:hypothetical protein JW960_05925 [candidate division KSB1 bacterium]|nr:hypothetical protein [candidate division KSB1 bacterium]
MIDTKIGAIALLKAMLSLIFNLNYHDIFYGIVRNCLIINTRYDDIIKLSP